jgi:prevent-host-death family protein
MLFENRSKKMEKIQLSDFQKNLHNVIASVNRSFKPVWITDEGRLLVKIVPVSTLEQKSWLGCMNGTGKIIGDIISPAESLEAWEVLSE